MKSSMMAAVVFGSTLLGLGGGALAAEVTLRFHQFLPPQATVPTYAIKPWIEQIEKASNGRIEIKLYNTMALGGKPPELFDQAKNGVVDVIWTVLSYTPGRFPKTEVFELPFIAGGAEATSKAFQAYVEQNAMDEFKDVKLIAVHTHGPGVLHTNKPVEKIDDLKGLRIRSGSHVITTYMSKLGATPVGMPVSGVGEALSKGVIDGTTLPWEVVPAFKIQQQVRYHTMFDKGAALYVGIFGLVINKAKYESLPADLRKVIDDASGMGTAALFGRALDEGDMRAMEMIKKSGNRVTVIDASEMPRWKQHADEMTSEWIERADKAGLDGKGLVEKARALLDEHSN